MRKRLDNADVAWVLLWVWVFIWNTRAAARQHRGETCELLSEAVDRYLSRHRLITELWLVMWYAHLSNHVPNRFDPVHWLDTGIRRMLR